MSCILLRLGRLPLFLLSLSWFLVSVAPAWVTLSFSYVIDGPRLLYMASVGTSLAWALLLGSLLDIKSIRHTIQITALLLFGAIVWQSVTFIEERNDLYVEGTRLLRQIVEATATSSKSLVVNMPSWLAVKETNYLLGHTGVQIVPEYIGLGRAVYVHSGVEPEIESLTLGTLLRSYKYHFGPHGPIASMEQIDAAIRRADAVFITEFTPDVLLVRKVGALQPGPRPPPVAYLADFEGFFVLEAARAQRRGEEISLELHWTCLQHVSVDYTVFVHLYNEQGQLVTQADGYPMASLSPLRLWKAGDIITDLRSLPVPAALTPGEYTIAMGLYDRATGERLAAYGPGGERYANDSVAVLRLKLPQMH